MGSTPTRAAWCGLSTARGKAWLIRELGELESAGSNPAALTVKLQAGRGKACAIRLPWEQENAGSNPAIPIRRLFANKVVAIFVSTEIGKEY